MFDYYNPYQYMPQQNVPQIRQPQPAQQSGLTWVQGLSGAKSYMVSPGSSVLLMDSETQRFYIKSADAAGMPLPLRIFDFTEITANENKCVPESSQTIDMHQYITREEFEKKIAEIRGVNADESIV